MAGIYLHIPFCRQACTYCNFHFSTSLRHKAPLINALQTELETEKNYLQGAPIETVYFGGGTPSILEVSDLQLLMSGLFKHYPITAGAEITLEANPDDISIQKLQEWKALGINRLSIGVQSFFEEELRWMNRAHNAEQAVSGLQLAVQYFDNITIDLIYGSPLLTDEMWKQNVDTATSLGISHLSCYALTVEEKTPLDKAIRTQKTSGIEDEKQARQFLLLMEWLKEKGYDHYEVSNFAKPGFRSRHNSAYWKGVPYLGLGPSAHSFNGVERRWNIANNAVYLQSVDEGKPKRENEVLTPSNRINEAIMIALRTSEGVDVLRIEKEFGFEERARLEKSVQKFVKQGWVKQQNTIYQLTNEGMLRADGVAAELFV